MYPPQVHQSLWSLSLSTFNHATVKAALLGSVIVEVNEASNALRRLASIESSTSVGQKRKGNDNATLRVVNVHPLVTEQLLWELMLQVPHVIVDMNQYQPISRDVYTCFMLFYIDS
jgi:hypothetical protein